MTPLAGSARRLLPDAQIADIARDLVKGIRGDLSVDWTSTRAARQQSVRRSRAAPQAPHRPPGRGVEAEAVEMVG